MLFVANFFPPLGKQKGTIVEKLVEEIVKDSQHLRHLIGICEGNFYYLYLLYLINSSSNNLVSVGALIPLAIITVSCLGKYGQIMLCCKTEII